MSTIEKIEQNCASPWLDFKQIEINYRLKFDKINSLCKSGEWPQGYVWQKTAEGKTGKKLFRREAIETWLSLRHDASAWARAIENFCLTLRGNQPHKPGRKPKLPSTKV